MSREYKVGDRVRVTEDEDTREDFADSIMAGDVGEVTWVVPDSWYQIMFDRVKEEWHIQGKYLELVDKPVDMVNHPPHYKLPNGIEVIDITENLGFRLGNTVKYILRADHKGKPVEDLKKARWYLDREIEKREA